MTLRDLVGRQGCWGTRRGPWAQRRGTESTGGRARRSACRCPSCAVPAPFVPPRASLDHTGSRHEPATLRRRVQKSLSCFVARSMLTTSMQSACATRVGRLVFPTVVVTPLVTLGLVLILVAADEIACHVLRVAKNHDLHVSCVRVMNLCGFPKADSLEVTHENRGRRRGLDKGPRGGVSTRILRRSYDYEHEGKPD